MGALIRTAGTVQLIKLFNSEFSKSGISNYRNGKVAGTNNDIKDQFDKAKNPNNKLTDITNNVKHKHNGSNRRDLKCLLPGDATLAARWMTFLGSLGAPHHEAIRDAIFSVLSNPDTYDSIQFDCVDGTTSSTGSAITAVLVSDESDMDPDGNVTSYYKKIVLVTPPMAAPA